MCCGCPPFPPSTSLDVPMTWLPRMGVKPGPSPLAARVSTRVTYLRVCRPECTERRAELLTGTRGELSDGRGPGGGLQTPPNLKASHRARCCGHSTARPGGDGGTQPNGAARAPVGRRAILSPPCCGAGGKPPEGGVTGQTAERGVPTDPRCGLRGVC